MDATFSRGASPIAVTAALSVAVLIAAVGSYIGDKSAAAQRAPLPKREPIERHAYLPVADADANGKPDWQDELERTTGVQANASINTASSTEEDPVATLGGAVFQSLASNYLSLKEYDAYTPERGKVLGETLASRLRAPVVFTPHTTDELSTTNDTSPERILQYRADMRAATAPMVNLSAEPEFSLFARYVATEDTRWLDALSDTAQTYREVERNILAITVPANASGVHVRAANAVGKFAETLERLVRFANDPIASAALLRTYNEDEREFLLAFDALAKFYVQYLGQ